MQEKKTVKSDAGEIQETIKAKIRKDRKENLNS